MFKDVKRALRGAGSGRKTMEKFPPAGKVSSSGDKRERGGGSYMAKGVHADFVFYVGLKKLLSGSLPT